MFVQRQTQPPPPKEVATMKPTEGQIRASAHEIFCARAGSGDSPEEDWLLAEQHLEGVSKLSGTNVLASAVHDDGHTAQRRAHVSHHLRNHHP